MFRPLPFTFSVFLPPSRPKLLTFMVALAQHHTTTSPNIIPTISLPTLGTESIVTPESFCAAACLDRPPAEAPVAAEVPLALVPAATPQPAPARAMLPVASSSASSSARAPAHPVADAPRAAMVQWRCNVEPRACGFSSYRYQAPSVFLALQLTSKLKTLGTNGEFHQV